MNANEIKAIVAEYWRFKRQCPVIAFEVTDYRLNESNSVADVLTVLPNGTLVETEVKVSIPDLRRDRQKRKHTHWRRGPGRRGLAISPIRQFYFALPADLANEAAILCDSLFPYAGVLGVYDKDLHSHTDAVTVRRRARSLSDRKLSVLEIGRLVRAQSGTLCHLARVAALARVGERMLTGVDNNAATESAPARGPA